MSGANYVGWREKLRFPRQNLSQVTPDSERFANSVTLPGYPVRDPKHLTFRNQLEALLLHRGRRWFRLTGSDRN